MSGERRITIGLVELPDIGLVEPLGANRTAAVKGNVLISKQVLMANLEAVGFDDRLYNLRQGDEEEAYGEVVWNGLKLTKVMRGRSYRSIDPTECDVWGVTSNHSQLRNAARFVIRHLRKGGRPVIVGGSDVIAELPAYLEAGADAAVTDKTGACNWAVIDALTGRSPRGPLSGVTFRDGRTVSLRWTAPVTADLWPLPSLEVTRACFGTEYWSDYFPEHLKPIGSIVADIGCDRKCDFCQTPEYKLGYKAMSPERTLQHARRQQEAGAGSIVCSSDQFLARMLWKEGRDQVLEIMKGLRDMRLTIQWVNGLEIRKLTRGRGFNRESTDLSPDEELIQALLGWDGQGGCYHTYVPAERPLEGRQNYAKLLPWQEHCEMVKAIARTGIPSLTYGVILGFEDDDDRALSLLEEGVVSIYEEVMRINPALNFQVAPFGVSPIPGTPLGERLRRSGLLRFDDPDVFGGIWMPCVDTNHLTYGEIAAWQKRLLRIGNNGTKSQFIEKVFQ